jgi:feruloyl esterase
MEAQRYPEDYDGILAGAPAIGISTFHAAQIWAAQHTLTDPERFISAEQYTRINEYLLETWDAADGAADGLIEDPRRVDIDFDAVASAAGLSEAQVNALRALYHGPLNAAGESVYPGLMPGGETQWQPLVGGPKPFPIAPAIYGHMVFEDPAWDWRTFNYDADLRAAQAKLGDVMDTLDPDLSAFRARGGKLIVYHGWSDFGISPEATRRYYEDVTRVMGGRAATQAFARLFLLPGVGHCRGGSGPDTFDGLTPLVNWVEHEAAPERIIASRVVNGVVVRTRPLCPYPRVARWTGHGSIDAAENFECIEPDDEV